MPHRLCFAYGSNMLPARLTAAERAPSATWVGPAVLDGHVLTFEKVGADGSGKCHIAVSPSADARVYGVLYRLEVADLTALDRAEGGYERASLPVWQAGPGAAAPVEAETYRALPERCAAGCLPFDWYHALVVAGAERAGLPPAYITWLRAQPVVVDADADRRARHLALIPRF